MEELSVGNVVSDICCHPIIANLDAALLDDGVVSIASFIPLGMFADWFIELERERYNVWDLPLSVKELVVSEVQERLELLALEHRRSGQIRSEAAEAFGEIARLACRPQKGLDPEYTRAQAYDRRLADIVRMESDIEIRQKKQFELERFLNDLDVKGIYKERPLSTSDIDLERDVPVVIRDVIRDGGRGEP